MIFAGCDKKERRSQWFTTPPTSEAAVGEAIRWCQKHPSTGRFYRHFTNTCWWFEYEKDAVEFALLWSDHV